MSEDQLSALLAKLKEDAGLRQKLQGAGEFDAFVMLAKEAGFDVGKEDWLKYQAKQTFELSDEELESAPGGRRTAGDDCCNDSWMSPPTPNQTIRKHNGGCC